MALFKKKTSVADHSDIEYALALHKRNEVRRDGLTLTKAFSQLDIEWRARDIHPWDRDRRCSPEEKERLFNEQCFSDTEAAIFRLFSALPVLDEIQFRVVGPDSDHELLSGRVARHSLGQITGGASPRGRLRQMGINVCVIGFCLLLPLLGALTIQRPIPTSSPKYGGADAASSFNHLGLKSSAPKPPNQTTERLSKV
jgi:hypothetical protein